MDDDRYPAIFEKKLDLTLRLCSPDVVNEYGRDHGLPVQAKALTHNIRGVVLVSWPPTKRGDADFEYGMDLDSLYRSLGYEILSNVCRLDTDPKGR